MKQQLAVQALCVPTIPACRILIYNLYLTEGHLKILFDLQQARYNSG